MPSIVKKDGSRTEFDRRKIVASMQLALRKRPVAADAIDAAVARIEYQLLGSGEREVRSERLGELVMGELRELDKVAFVRFASVYRRFEDVSEFEDVIEEFRRAGANNPAKKR
jgi:transcriptional repressor NrdR